MYSTIDAISMTVDFAKNNIEDGVIDSLHNCGAGRSLGCSTSPLRGCQLTYIWQCSCLPLHQNVYTPQRQLYCKASLHNTEEAKENDSADNSNEVFS